MRDRGWRQNVGQQTVRGFGCERQAEFVREYTHTKIHTKIHFRKIHFTSLPLSINLISHISHFLKSSSRSIFSLPLRSSLT